uniref:Uncharacterized protein n=1 Tax=Citrifermentans bremense TaxID=60035 RepID=A0A6S6M5X9_9BACT
MRAKPAINGIGGAESVPGRVELLQECTFPKISITFPGTFRKVSKVVVAPQENRVRLEKQVEAFCFFFER